MTIAVWVLTSFLMLVGLAGVIVPVLPGTALILGAALLHSFLAPEPLASGILWTIAAIFVVSVVADFGGVLLGTRWFGGSKWGMAGASGGALIGIFFSLPVLVLGTIFGAVAAEKLIEKKTGRDSLKAGLGAATGFVISTVARLVCAVAMIAVFLFGAIG